MFYGGYIPFGVFESHGKGTKMRGSFGHRGRTLGGGFNLMLEVCSRPCLEKSLLTFAFLGVSGPNAERHKLLARHSGILVFSIYRFQNHVPEKHTRMGGVKLMLEVCIRPCREKFPFTLGLWGVSGPKAERHKLFSRYNGISMFFISLSRTMFQKIYTD